MYDVGIQPDAAYSLDIEGLCVALNKAEKEKRDAIYAKDEKDRTDKENRLIEGWEKETERIGVSGSEQIITKDPTVLVAGGSLIAASRTSLLEPDDFSKALKELEA